MKKILLVLALLFGSSQAMANAELTAFVTDNTSFSTLSTVSLGFGAKLGFHAGPKWTIAARGMYQSGPTIYATGQLNYMVSSVFDLGVQAGIASTTVSVALPGFPAVSATASSFVFGPHLGFWFGGAKIKFGFDVDYLLTTTSALNTASFQPSAGLKFML